MDYQREDKTNWREVAKERWIKIADQHAEIERLRAALQKSLDKNKKLRYIKV